MSKHQTLTIAFDIDDTITRQPAFFAFISQALVRAGHRVVIITFRDDPQSTASDLRQWGIAYDELICWSMDGCDLTDVDGWKANVCREHGVDVFFEDDPDVLSHVDPATVCFMPFGSMSKAQRWQLRSP